MAVPRMDPVDQNLINAEREASPDRFRAGRPSHEIERVLTASSTSSISTRPATSASHRTGTGMSRISTQNDLERHPTAISRIATARSQHTQTVGTHRRSSTASRASRKDLPAFGAGKPYPPLLPDREEYVVEFDGHEDPLHAQNWPLRKKLLTSCMLAYTTLVSTFTSSIFSASTLTVAAEFNVGREVALLGTTFYVLGFAFGPTIWAPFSELKGRRIPLLISMFGFSIFTISVAVAKDIQTILICRFFSGIFGSCPLAVVAAVFSDLFDNNTRGVAITIFSMCVFTGPLFAPFLGGFIVTSYLGWRWTQYIPSFMGFFALILNVFFLEETYPPVILVSKAGELRRRTKNWGIHAKQEEIEVDLRELLTKNFSRPLRLLFTEPIVLVMSIYMSFIYGLLYLFLTAYPLVFSGVHGFTPGLAGLAFVGMITGELIAGAVVLMQQPWYNRKLAANNGIPQPEWRLPSMMIGGIVFAIGIFWFGWSGYKKDVHWIVPALSGLCTGFGLLSIFLQALNYLVDAYLVFAASAIAGNTFLRSLAGAGFPLFAQQMFDGMGIQWASTLLGCVALVLCPIPFILYFKGPKIRAKSAYAPTNLNKQVDGEDEGESGEDGGVASGREKVGDEGTDNALMATRSRRHWESNGNGNA